MRDTLTLILPFPPKELSPNKRLYWAKVSSVKKAYRADCYWLAKAATHQKFDPNSKLHITLTFYPPDRRHRDDDNMEAAFKAGRDGVAEALGVNDRLFTVTRRVADEPLNFVQMQIKTIA